MQLRSAHIATIVVGLAVIAGAGVALLRPNDDGATTISADQPVGKARLLLESRQVSVGQEFTMDLKLDTAGDETVGTDLVLTFDNQLLEVLDSDPAQPGTQLTAGPLFDITPANSANQADGVIVYSGSQQPTNPSVEGINSTVATVRFRAKAAGQAQVRYVFTAGALNDSNVVEAEGSDLLAGVQNAVVTVGP